MMSFACTDMSVYYGGVMRTYRNRSSLCHLEMWRGLASNYSCVANFFLQFSFENYCKVSINRE